MIYAAKVGLFSETKYRLYVSILQVVTAVTVGYGSYGSFALNLTISYGSYGSFS